MSGTSLSERKKEHRASEYQYYEFRALDRRLTSEQQKRLRTAKTGVATGQTGEAGGDGGMPGIT